jgi:hypothetical protein
VGWCKCMRALQAWWQCPIEVDPTPALNDHTQGVELSPATAQGWQDVRTLERE